jgi:hypothetical protein
VVKGCAGEVTYRGDGGAEGTAYLGLEGVELGVVEETELEGEVLADEESADEADSARLFEKGGGESIDEGYCRVF